MYSELFKKIESGIRWSINLEKRNLKVGNKKYISNGVLSDGIVIPNTGMSLNDILCQIKALYQSYKTSMPSTRSEKHTRPYFKALSMNDTDTNGIFDFVIGANRELARFKLEGFILQTIITEEFKWDECEMGKWFWRDQDDKDLVILREWIDGIKEEDTHGK